MSSAVRIDRIEIRGWRAPLALEIHMSGRLDRDVGDGITRIMREAAPEFERAVAEAFERIYLARLDAGMGGIEAWRRRPAAPLADAAHIEDIEL